jgi:hypothetical protein
MTVQTITLRLPEPLYRTARQIAQVTKRPIETVLQDSLSAVLPPLDDVEPHEAAQLARLALLDDAALWGEARTLMTRAEQTELQCRWKSSISSLARSADLPHKTISGWRALCVTVTKRPRRMEQTP